MFVYFRYLCNVWEENHRHKALQTDFSVTMDDDGSERDFCEQ